MDNKELINYIRLFREKMHTEKLIVFVGAGVSCNVDGMPDWNDLIKKMSQSISYTKCPTCKKKSKVCQDSCIYMDAFSTDEFLKIPQYVYNKSKNRYNRILKENISHPRGINAPLSNAIFDLSPAHIITTNYDKLLEDCQNEQRDNYGVIINDKDLLTIQKKKYIIKMHGDITDLNTIVLKESDYLEYSQKHVLIEMFVKALLTDHTILFLGYSLNDYNIKLIISWINYIRMQNKALNNDTRFGYIVLDAPKITKMQRDYFEGNNIGVINLKRMPIVNNIPDSLNSDIGKRLYSFLRVIENPAMEYLLGVEISFAEAIGFIKSHQFVDCKNICSLLSIRKYHINGHELTLYSEYEYSLLYENLCRETTESQVLNQAFYDAGIYYIRLNSTSTDISGNYEVKAKHCSIYDNPFFGLYLKNDYTRLNSQIAVGAEETLFESCFYESLIRDYTDTVFTCHSRIEYDNLTIEQKVRYLFNTSVLESRKNFHYDGRSISKYIHGIADVRVQKLFSPYLDLLDGNYQILNAIETSLKKLKEQYYNSHHTFLTSSLFELHNIRRIALSQYLFYFKNTLFFKGFADLKKILGCYVEAIICTNGDFDDITINSDFGFRSVKKRYQIDAIDFDIMTKFVSIKDLNNLMEEYSVKHLSVSEGFIDYVIDCFDNMAASMICLNLYHRFYSAPSTIVNCINILLHLPLSEEQKSRASGVVESLFCSGTFVHFFFSINYPDFSLSTKILCRLLETIPLQPNFDIVKRIMCGDEFKSYYVNLSVRDLRSIMAHFIDDAENQSEIHSLLLSFDGKDRIIALRLLYKHITNLDYISEHKAFVADNFNKLSVDDIYDFSFNDWLEITENHQSKILSDAINIYKQQKTSAIRSYPDPLQKKLELVYILYLTKIITCIDRLKEIVDASDFLRFFLEPEKFDYSKVDLSNYMWENIARDKDYMELLIQNKDCIMPNIIKRIEQGNATEFERKVLYGYFEDTDALLDY